MSSVRTKALMWCAGLIGLVLAVPVVLPKVIPYVFANFSSNTTVFVSVHFHIAPFITLVIIWVAVVVCARISFQYDKRHRSGQ